MRQNICILSEYLHSGIIHISFIEHDRLISHCSVNGFVNYGM